MARYVDSVCRHCRLEGQKLYFKGERCYTGKCAIERRNYPPGQHGHKPKKPTDYGVQLREKQKVRKMYCLLERQFHKIYVEASRMKGVTGENLLSLLERRLDNVVYRLSFASSRVQARQMIGHRHFEVNGQIVNIPSYRCKAGDVVTLREISRKRTQRRSVSRKEKSDNPELETDLFNKTIKESLELAAKRGVVRWLSLDPESFSGTLEAYPERDELPMPVRDVKEQLIVEYYSR